MNIDENTINNIKNMVDNGNIQDAISQISPEMIQNFSKMLSNQENNKNENNSQNFNNYNQNNINQKNNYNTHNINEENNFNSNQNNINQGNNFDFSNIDMNTIMKMTSALGKINSSKNDPSANLLNSLKPYLRDSKKDKLDNYMNLLNIAKIAEIVKDNNKENK